MPRSFTAASSHKVVTGLGNLGFAFGPGTLAAICYPTATAAATAIGIGAANAQSYMLQTALATGTNTWQIRLNGTSVNSASTISTNKWYCLVVSKANGNVKPRFHNYDYSTGTWTHEDSGSNLANSSAPATQGQLGCTPAGAAFWGGDIAVAGIWNVVLTDAQTEALAFSLSAWWAVQPKGLFVLDQSDTAIKINDITGGGANESSLTGTAVSTNNVPVWSYGHDIFEALVTAPVGAADKPKTLLTLGVG